MDAGDLELRRRTYAQFVALGRAPAPDEMAKLLHLQVPAVVQGWRRLHDEHALVLDEAREAIRMANPFSAVPTVHRVLAAGRWWYANCAWDAFGICAALHVDGVIETSCADCSEELLFHCLVPAAQWWDDIVFT